jgi:hypothetical protein
MDVMKHIGTSTSDGVLLNIHQVLENYAMSLQRVLDVERRIEVQKTTRVNNIGRLKEQAFNFHAHSSIKKNGKAKCQQMLFSLINIYI